MPLAIHLRARTRAIGEIMAIQAYASHMVPVFCGRFNSGRGQYLAMTYPEYIAVIILVRNQGNCPMPIYNPVLPSGAISATHCKNRGCHMASPTDISRIYKRNR